MRTLGIAAVALLLPACAPALPPLAGGDTTPGGRGDLALGGSARVPFGELRDHEDAVLNEATTAGVAPVAQGRIGLGNHTDVGLRLQGNLARASLRKRWQVERQLGLLVGAAPYAGWVPDRGGDRSPGRRLGLDVPLTLGARFNGVYEAWGGLRFAMEHATAPNEPRESVLGMRAGLILGLAVGFRRLHALLELTADYEYWAVQSGSEASYGGMALTPAFALRFRL